MPRSAKATGYLCALAATVIWSGNFIVARALADTVPPVTTSFLRWVTALVVILPFGLGAVRRDMPLLRANLTYFIMAGITGVSVFNTFIYIAGRTTEAINMALIASSSPVWIIILSRILLGEAVTLRRAAGVAVSLCGTLVLVTRGDFTRLASLRFAVGDLWMLAAALTFASYSVLLRKKPEGVSALGSLTTTFAIGVVGILPMLAWEWGHGAQLAVTPAVVGAVLYIGIGASLLAYLCWSVAVERIGPAKSALVYYSLPLFSATEAALLLGETITLAHVASCALIVGGILIATMQRAPAAK